MKQIENLINYIHKEDNTVTFVILELKNWLLKIKKKERVSKYENKLTVNTTTTIISKPW